MLNKIQIQGRLTRNPEQRYTQSNIPVSTYTLAVDRGRKDANGNSQADFIDCVAWNKKSEFAQKYMNKGAMFIVTGRLQSRHWEDKHGNKRTSWEVIVDEQIFCESKKDRAPSPADDPTAYGYDAPAPSFDMPTGNAGFSELEDDSDVPF